MTTVTRDEIPCHCHPSEAEGSERRHSHNAVRLAGCSALLSVSVRMDFSRPGKSVLSSECLGFSIPLEIVHVDNPGTLDDEKDRKPCQP